MTSYTVVHRHDESGWWFTRIKELQGCHTQGKTLKQARERIEEALALFVEDADSIELVEEVELPEEVKSLVVSYIEAQQEAERKQQEVQELSRKAAKILNQDLKLGMRDTGQLLHLSHQRIQQLVNS
ncbi:MAG TPA: type II toxin-antitoxin system HicB family antitoxin [Candidatus Obscuribacterales bacterium]